MVSSEATVLSDRHGQHIAISTIDRTYATPMLVTRSMAMWRRPETPIRDIKQFGISGDGMPGELASAGLRKPKTGYEGPTHTKNQELGRRPCLRDNPSIKVESAKLGWCMKRRTRRDRFAEVTKGDADRSFSVDPCRLLPPLRWIRERTSGPIPTCRASCQADPRVRQVSGLQ
jgi:hypothetical protein